MAEEVKVLVVEDDPAMSQYLKSLLTDMGYRVFCSFTGEEALEAVKLFSPALVLVDIGLPDVDGMELLRKIASGANGTSVVVVSGYCQPQRVVQAMKLGAADFLMKPLDPEDLKRCLIRLLDGKRDPLSFNYPGLEVGIPRDGRYMTLVGNSQKMRNLRNVIDQVADTDITVLVSGESGTGKELVARSLHYLSTRRKGPFVKVNCAALPGDLLESELFGYEKGSFTGAGQRKLGKFELANKGTIFLDEISEMAPPMQAKLLQVLQDGEFSRLGGARDVRVDSRVISATNKDLRKGVGDGTFREDLFYRLNVVGIHIPPLRERRDEIPILTEFFLRHYCSQYGKGYRSLLPETMELFMKYDWPGNVRELENIIKRTIVMDSEASALAEFSLSPALPGEKGPITETPRKPESLSLKEVGKTAALKAEREAILKVLKQTRWNRKRAAQMLGISYKALLYKIKDTGLDLRLTDEDEA